MKYSKNLIINNKLTFPLATAINFFSITALLIIAGLLGHEALAADIALVQAATVAIFLSLSGNARNLILASGKETDEKSLLYFRLTAMVPAVGAVYYLIQHTFDISIYTVTGLIIRKCAEWVAELQLANNEKNNNHAFALKYIKFNILSFIGLILMLLISTEMIFFFWIIHLGTLTNNFGIKLSPIYFFS